MALAYVEALRDNQLDEITSFAGTSAKLRIYDGSRPATGGTATTLLAELVCDATAFAAAASSGALTVNSISDDTSADATGTATWFRLVTSGDAFVMDGDVGTSGSDLNMDSVDFQAGGTVSVSSWVITGGNA